MKYGTALVTGTTSGLGRVLVEELLHKGFEVVSMNRSPVRNRNSSSELHFNVDISDAGEVQRAFDAIDWLRIEFDLVINNAGIFSQEKLSNISYEDIHRIIDTNLKGTIFVTKEAIERMTPNGRLINISSVSGLQGIPNQSVYSATKAGIKAFGEALAQERDILVTTIYPGGLKTELWDKHEYDGDVNELVYPVRVWDMIESIIDLPDNVVVKEMTVFPRTEWHP